MTAQTSGTGTGSGADRPPATEQAKNAAGTAADEGKHVAGVAGDEAKHVAGVAGDQAKHVAGVATDEAKQLATEATSHARDLAGELRSQVADQTKSQRDRLVQALHQITDELDTMAESGGGSGVATEVVRQVSTRARDLASMVENREPGDVLGDVRRMASRRPGAFLLGALAAGLLAGRVTRGVKTDTTDTSSTGAVGALPAGGTTGYPATPPPPVTGTGYPATTGYSTGTAGSVPPRAVPPVGGPGAIDPVEPGLPPSLPNDDLNNRGGNP